MAKFDGGDIDHWGDVELPLAEDTVVHGSGGGGDSVVNHSFVSISVGVARVCVPLVSA